MEEEDVSLRLPPVPLLFFKNLSDPWGLEWEAGGGGGLELDSSSEESEDSPVKGVERIRVKRYKRDNENVKICL